ncbi:enediyne antibiotic chromoprotein [Streptomyces sp. NPDC053048]|uniref:enediyne antibiotic chromoprotein n=1 Tax=Streptomyces sp. NPDC053048 TaxID=3365694 RepID=UPI0037CE6447
MNRKFSSRLLPKLATTAVLALGVSVAAQAPALAAEAQISVTPSDDLTDGQTVTVTVTDADPDTEYFIGQCGTVQRAQACDADTGTIYRTDDEGMAAFPFVVHRTFLGETPEGRRVGAVDCTTVRCYIGTGKPGEDLGNVQIHFAGK